MVKQEFNCRFEYDVITTFETKLVMVYGKLLLKIALRVYSKQFHGNN